MPIEMIENKLELLIDDMRHIVGVDYTCRTVDKALGILRDQPITHLWLDNDLGDDQPMEGVDILAWARDNNLVPPYVRLVTANPVAKKRMEDILKYDLKYVKEGNWWKKTT